MDHSVRPRYLFILRQCYFSALKREIIVAAVKDVMKVCPKDATVVVESTVSPGTIDKYVRPVIEANGFKIGPSTGSGSTINLVHAPERIIPGNMVYELLHNNRTISADNRESPTLQMLDIQERHLARPLKSFDPFFTEKAIVKNQILDFDQFLSEVDMVVIMVKHDHIKQNWDKLKGKVVLDCHNICPLEGVYLI